MVTRLSGGITPADGADPRTFPTIWNATADTIESQGTAITTAESDIDALEAKNIPAFGTATPSDGQVLAYSTAISAYEPSAAVGDLDSLSDVSVTSVSDGDLLAYDSGTSEWVNQALEVAQLPTGSVLQVVSTTKTDTFTASLAAGAISSDAISATITPTSASSKVLVLVQYSGSSSVLYLMVFLYKDGSPSDYRGDAASNRSRGVGTSPGGGTSTTATFLGSINYLDSPATTSAVTYSVRLAHPASSTQSVYLNRSDADNDVDDRVRGASSITLMEIAG